MTRLLLFLMFYGISFFLGFAVRARYDAWMYAKPHMQGRLRVFAQELTLYDLDQEAEAEDFFPPSTTDPLAFNAAQAERAVRDRQVELDEEFDEFSKRGPGPEADSAPAPGPVPSPSAPASGSSGSDLEPERPSDPDDDPPYAAAGQTAAIDPVVEARNDPDPLRTGRFDAGASGGYRVDDEAAVSSGASLDPSAAVDPDETPVESGAGRGVEVEVDRDVGAGDVDPHTGAGDGAEALAAFLASGAPTAGSPEAADGSSGSEPVSAGDDDVEPDFAEFERAARELEERQQRREGAQGSPDEPS